MELREYTKQKNELSKKLQAHAKTMLKPVFKEFFDSTPEIEAITWTQYTPHFNDGDCLRLRCQWV